MRFAFMGRHIGEFPVAAMCRALKVSRSGYYACRTRPQSSRASENRRLAVVIGEIERLVKHVYGSPRVHRELKARGERISRKRVARLMKHNGIQVRFRRRFRVTTQSNPGHAVAPNVLNRKFRPSGPNQAWAGDITYVWTREGWLYLAVVIDLYSRMVVGWAMSERMHRKIVIDAVQMALGRRKASGSLIHHSDRGCQYTSAEFRTLLCQNQMTASMSRKGNCWDNAVSESFFSSMKVELENYGAYETRRQAREEIFEYIELFFNGQRRHSTLGYLSPREFESKATAA